MTSFMESQLKSLRSKHGQYSEVMIYGPSGYAIERLLLDRYSELLYSTNPEEYAQVQALRAQGMSLDAALEILVRAREERSGHP
jgi:conjugal transfer ATP-binding protein TraC